MNIRKCLDDLFKMNLLLMSVKKYKDIKNTYMRMQRSEEGTFFYDQDSYAEKFAQELAISYVNEGWLQPFKSHAESIKSLYSKASMFFEKAPAIIERKILDPENDDLRVFMLNHSVFNIKIAGMDMFEKKMCLTLLKASNMVDLSKNEMPGEAIRCCEMFYEGYHEIDPNIDECVRITYSMHPVYNKRVGRVMPINISDPIWDGMISGEGLVSEYFASMGLIDLSA